MARTASKSEAVAAAWSIHADLRARAVDSGDSAAVALLDAREATADLFPGCATAILSPDQLRNWDRGAVMRAELEKRAEKPENG